MPIYGPGYGQPYDPNFDPVLAARRARNATGVRDDAVAEDALWQMDDRAGIRHANPGMTAPGDIALSPIERAAQPGPATPSAIMRHPASGLTPPPQPEPSDMEDPGYGSPIERAAFTPRGEVPGSIQAGATSLRDTEWKGVGGGLRSSAQMEQDLYAHDLINRGYRQSVGQNELEENVRGNPMERAIEGRKHTLAYEDLLPADATSHIRFGQGSDDGALMDYADQQAPELGMPTMGEHRNTRSLIAQAAAKQNPKDVAEGALGMGRGRIAEELSILRQRLDEGVSRARGTPDEAKVRAAASERWARAMSTAKALAEIMKTGFPRSDDESGAPGAPAPGYGPTTR